MSHDVIDDDYLAALLADAETMGPRRNGHAVDLGDLESWRPVALAPVLAGQVERIRAEVLVRSDGAGLLYRERINGFHGDSGIGRSIVAAVVAAQEMAAGRAVAWFDFEDPNAETVVERLRALGVADNVIEAQFLYFHPEGPPTDENVVVAIEALHDHGAVLCVLDSVGESMGAAGLDENSDADVNAWARRLARRLEAAGHTVVLIDHTTKAHDNPLHPSGSKRKRALVSGSSWLLEQVTPFDRAHPGKAKLVCAKDRHGNFRRGAVGAWIHIDPTQGGIRAEIEAPSEDLDGPRGDRVDAVLVSRVVEVVKAAGTNGLNLRGLRAAVRLKVKATNTVLDDATELAIGLGYVREDKGPRNARVFTWRSDPDADEIERTFG